jgi:hypothetical protein
MADLKAISQLAEKYRALAKAKCGPPQSEGLFVPDETDQALSAKAMELAIQYVKLELIATRRGYCLHERRVNICAECLAAIEKIVQEAK